MEGKQPKMSEEEQRSNETLRDKQFEELMDQYIREKLIGHQTKVQTRISNNQQRPPTTSIVNLTL